jgi:hypothetical protein
LKTEKESEDSPGAQSSSCEDDLISITGSQEEDDFHAVSLVQSTSTKIRLRRVNGLDVEKRNNWFLEVFVCVQDRKQFICGKYMSKYVKKEWLRQPLQ